MNSKPRSHTAYGYKNQQKTKAQMGLFQREEQERTATIHPPGTYHILAVSSVTLLGKASRFQDLMAYTTIWHQVYNQKH